jgi:hypothetical protein
LFWRKKKKSDIELPEDDRDLRRAYRIQPDRNRPIILTVAGNSYQLVNVSATGCCFRSHNFSEGSQAVGTLKIPSEDLIFPVSIEVVAKQRDLCRCQFSKISASGEDAIHAYVLEVQKSWLRQNQGS